MNNALNGFKFTKAGNEACITHLFHKIIPYKSKFCVQTKYNFNP